MNSDNIIKSLLKIFPKEFLEDFAVSDVSLAGPNSEAIEDHLKMVCRLTHSETEVIRKKLYIISI